MIRWNKHYRIKKVYKKDSAGKFLVERRFFWFIWMEEQWFYALDNAQEYIENQRTRLSEIISEHVIQ